MSRRNPYGFNKEFNPDDILDNLKERESAESGEPPAADEAAPPAELSDADLQGLARERICPSCPQGKEAEDVRLRALAEVDNMRKRLVKEKEEAIKFAASNVLSDILPALDNLDLALEHARGQEACKDLLVGVEMTRKLMLDALKKHGLEVVGQVGEAFDPAFHEALGMSASPDVDDGAICHILNKGYKLHERLLRPARVVVCKK
ncbi:MAG: nucleotide exchange factor GrpE [Deltaproteobacteria bacterium]|jgi:molecular chaperone GrpE|nr:nucleotide exchange factor GrpE [Deltaproteobacteria bacterium]